MNTWPVVALGSGQGSTIEFFCKKTMEGRKAFKIKAIITENPDSRLLKVAEKFKLPSHVVEYKDKDFEIWDQELCKTLLTYKPQLILLAGFLKKIGPAVLEKFQNKIINSHPSLLPEFSGPGMYGLKVHQAVVKEKKSVTGVSIHIVNQNYDKGAILVQKQIPVQKKETALDLEKKVKRIEKEFYLNTILKICKGEIPLP